MALPLGTAVVEITGELKRLATALKAAQRMTGQAMRRAGEIGRRAFVTAFKALKWSLMGVVGGAVAALGAAFKAALDYAPVEDMRRALEGLAKSMGTTGDIIVREMQQASGYTMTARDAMRSFNLAAQLVSKDFASMLPDAIGYLRKVSAATGEDLSFLVDSLVRGVGRLSPVILDNLAIQVDLNEAYEVYAKKIGKSVRELTKQEKQMALMEQVMAKLQENTASMPDVADTAATAWAKFTTSLADMKNAIGALALPLFRDVLEGVAFRAQKVAKFIQELANALRDGELTAGRLRAMLSEAFGVVLGNRIAQIVETVRGLWRAFQEGGLQGQPLLDALAEAFGPEFAARFGQTVDAFYAFRDAVLRAWQVAKQFLLEVVLPFVQEHKEAIISALLAIGAVFAGLGLASLLAGIAGAIASLANPLALVLALAGLLGAAWAENWGGIRDALLSAWAAIQPVLTFAWEMLRTIAGVVWETLAPAFLSLWEVLKETFQGMGPVFAPLLDALKLLGIVLGSLLVGVVASAVGLLRGFVEALRRAAEHIRSLIEAMMGFVQGWLDMFWGIGQTIAGWLMNNESMMQAGMERIKAGLLGIWRSLRDGIVALVKGLVAIVFGLIQGFVEGVIEFFVRLYMALVGGSIVPELVQGVIGFIQILVATVTSLVAFFQDAVLGAFASVSNFVRDEFLLVLQRLLELFGGLVGFVANRVIPIFKEKFVAALKVVWDWLRNKLSVALDRAREIFGLLSDKVAWARDVLGRFREVLKAVVDWLKKAIEWVKKLAAKLAGLVLPKFLQRHSPSPIEMALAGMVEHLKRLRKVELPAFQQRLWALNAFQGLANTPYRESSTSVHFHLGDLRMTLLEYLEMAEQASVLGGVL